MALGLSKHRPRDIVYADDLTIQWRDDVVGHYPFRYLRNVCPCAGCVNELTGEKVLDPASIPEDIHIRKADYVGNYALRINWSDGHDTGIYAFSFLRELLERALQDGPDPDGPYVQQN